jgi:NADPH:quinone reductase-like Zn-dependent oxidoreductase
MKAAVVAAQCEDLRALELEIRDDWPRPELELTKKKKNQLLIRVLACSLAAGDVHLAQGRMGSLLAPPSLPFVPGMDVCGIVEEVSEGTSGAIQVGDCVVSSNGFSPVGGLAEYMVVSAENAVKKPEGVSDITAAACPCSASAAFTAVEKARIKEGDRVLVLGGSGGVGSAAVQLAKISGASFVATTTTQEKLLSDLGVDMVINYKSTNWWELEDFKKAPLDVIIDCVGGGQHYRKSRAVLKSSWSGGRFVPIAGDVPWPDLRTWYKAVGFIAGMMWRPMWTTFCPWTPSYSLIISSAKSPTVAKILGYMESGQLKIVLDEASPFPFTSEGVKNALVLQGSWHAHGKVVVQVASA